MRTPLPKTAALVLGVLCFSSGAASQPAFSLDAPVLIADGRTVPVEGAPLQQDPFGSLVLSIPALGTFTVADQPFEGARQAGEFGGARLVFAAQGVSVRLQGTDPLLDETRRPAYVRTEPSRTPSGPARVSLGGTLLPGTRPGAPPRALTAAPPAASPPRTPDAATDEDLQNLRRERAQLREERDEARSRLATLEAQAADDRDRLAEVTGQMEAARLAAPSPEALRDARQRERRLEGALAQTSAERDRLAEQAATAAQDLAQRQREAEDLRAEMGTLRSELTLTQTWLRESESARLGLEAELSALREEIARLRAQSAGPMPRQGNAAAVRVEAGPQAETVPLRQPDVSPLPQPAAREETVASPPARPGSAVISLPRFDFGRLTNAPEVRQRIEQSIPIAMFSETSGDVLVLLQTDPTGTVIRTAVPRPLGDSLDALAEQIVREMSFEPSRVDGQPTGIRTQVVVRFAPQTGS